MQYILLEIINLRSIIKNYVFKRNNLMEQFYNEHKIRKPNDGIVRLIIGESPYKQKLNSIPFSVDGKESRISLYKSIRNIAFLVNQWIKVQDSQEMLFNLLFGANDSIRAFANLKSFSISAKTFAEEIWEKTNTLLVNRFVNERDQKNKIKKFIKAEHKNNGRTYILFVGQEAFSNFGLLPRYVSKAIAIHPSGVNLNFESRQKTYTDCWFHCNNVSLINKDDDFDLKLFRIFD